MFARAAGDKLIADPARIQEWIHARSGLPVQERFRGLAREVNGEIVAAFGYDSFQDQSCAFHAASAGPGAITRRLVRMAFVVPFLQWQYKCLIGIINEGNKASLKLAHDLGFDEFAVLPEACSSGSLRFLSLNKRDCRWLKPAERTS